MATNQKKCIENNGVKEILGSLNITCYKEIEADFNLFEKIDIGSKNANYVILGKDKKDCIEKISIQPFKIKSSTTYLRIRSPLFVS